MREYKFRAKAIEEMADGDQLVYGFGVHVVELVNGEKEYVLHTENGTYQVDPKTVGQYTGLKDKNGKDICEGDIFVDNSYGEDVGQLIDSVVWSNEKGAWAWGKDEFAIVAESVDTIMVIGNIYDNPDLLGG